MSLVCFGLNYKTAPLALRERFVVADEKFADALQFFKNYTLAAEVLITSTCNRLELYLCGTESEQVVTALAHYFAILAAEFEKLVYFYRDIDAVRHLCRVACGLDSMILGEPQVLGQLKEAYRIAETAGTVGKQLGHLLPFVFATAKKIRTDTTLGYYPVSIAYAAISLAKHIFTDLKQTSVLLIGAGDMMELVAQHLADSDVKNMIVANRTVERAHKLAQKVGGKNITIGDIPQYLPEVDIVVSCTASQLPILGKGLVERSLKTRKHKPIFMVDLAVPRDIEPEVAELDDIYLYNIDDLQNVIKESTSSRLQAAEQAEAMLELEIEHFKHWQNSLQSVPVIRAYRERVEAMRLDTVKKASQDLKRGKPALDVIEELSRQLSNKLMHDPTVQIRQASYHGQQDLLEWAKKLLGIS